MPRLQCTEGQVSAHQDREEGLADSQGERERERKERDRKVCQLLLKYFKGKKESEYI
jgi:hypothetical protein